jgi:hypothetical protein
MIKRAEMKEGRARTAAGGDNTFNIYTLPPLPLGAQSVTGGAGGSSLSARRRPVSASWTEGIWNFVVMR